MRSLIPLLIAIVALVLVWRFVASLFRHREPVEPVEADPADDRYASVPAWRKKPPKGRSGVVALQEPDEAPPADRFPPKTI
jgi:hypothetical protein